MQHPLHGCSASPSRPCTWLPTALCSHCCPPTAPLAAPAPQVNATLRDFQDRLQRCVQRCQDRAQEKLPASPSDKEIEKAQVGGRRVGAHAGACGCSALLCCWLLQYTLWRSCRPPCVRAQKMLGDCAADCAQEYEKQVGGWVQGGSRASIGARHARVWLQASTACHTGLPAPAPPSIQVPKLKQDILTRLKQLK